MQHSRCFAILKSVCFVLSALIVFSPSLFAKTFKRQTDIPDKYFYAYVFHRVTEMNSQADNISDEREKSFLRNYFKQTFALSDEQNRILQTVASNFKTGFSQVARKQKFKLALLHRNELRKLFGDDEFERFDKMLRKEFGKDIIYSSAGPADFFGTVSITVNTATHTLYGNAGISFNDNAAENLSAPCSVSATMSGTNVSKSGSASGDCSNGGIGINPPLSDTDYLDNTQYCIVANFSGVSGPTTGTACLTTPPSNRVTSVTYEQILTDDLPIDNNPNAGGGLRIYPDRKIPTETVDRRKIRVKAQYSQAAAGVRIYFRNLDVDDPSANTSPIDIETTANAGDDNNGNIDGMAATKAGQLSIPQGATNCQTFTERHFVFNRRRRHRNDRFYRYQTAR